VNYRLAGNTPENLKPESILLSGNLEKLDTAIRAIFEHEADKLTAEAVRYEIYMSLAS